jgi:DNA adenine methylase
VAGCGAAAVGKAGMERDRQARPFLKWAGGKGQLLVELEERVRLAGPFGAYHEPFLGGGALFFHLRRNGLLRHGAFLSDGNPRLMDAWLGVRDHVDAVVAQLQEHAARHGPEHYRAVRAEVPGTLAGRAARVIYLNRTCFNGLYRENASGAFNVPMGRYANPRICDEGNLRAASRALEGVDLGCRPFATVLEAAREGDLAYLDPPYVPLTATASFTAYAAGGFGDAEQRRLAEVFGRLAAQGVRALLSNSMTERVRELYGRFTVDTVWAGRPVNRDASKRGRVAEALVRNW